MSQSSYSLAAKLAERFPDEVSQGLDIGLGVIEDYKATGTIDDKNDIGETLSMAAHRVAFQKICIDEADSMAACITLFGADSAIQEFFHGQEVTR